MLQVAEKRPNMQHYRLPWPSQLGLLCPSASASPSWSCSQSWSRSQRHLSCHLCGAGNDMRANVRVSREKDEFIDIKWSEPQPKQKQKATEEEEEAEEEKKLQRVRLLLWLEFLAWAFGFVALTLFAFCWCHKFALRHNTHFSVALIEVARCGFRCLRYRFTN